MFFEDKYGYTYVCNCKLKFDKIRIYPEISAETVS
jgi:hypothetical protein